MLPGFLKQLLLPPANLFLLALFGLMILRWRPRTGRFLMGLALLALYGLSTPLVSGALLYGLRHGEALTRFDHDVGAIVVLGGGNNRHAAEYGGDTVGLSSLGRLRYGARLHRLTGKPLLVTGGWGHGDHPSEGEAMAQAFEQSFGVAAAWIETRAVNTYENAANSAAILHPLGIDRVYLVTSGWHMRRAAASFEAVGFEVIPAPTFLISEPDMTPAALIPNAGSLHASATVFYETLGLAWYRLAYL